MPRIYYREEKICGQTIDDSVINLADFKFLLESKKPTTIQLPKTGSGKSLFHLFGRNEDVFNFVQFSVDGIHYQAEEGHFYLPGGIIFYDVQDFPFPTLFYFIARIGDQLEARFVNGGPDTKWFQVADKHQPVTNKADLQKIENTVKKALEFVKNYREPEPPKPVLIKGFALDKNAVTQLLSALKIEDAHFRDALVNMAAAPSDYFAQHREQLQAQGIFAASENLHRDYLIARLQKENRMATVDWKESFEEILHVVNSLSRVKIEKSGTNDFSESFADEILAKLAAQLESQTGQTIFCIDTGSDSTTFGLVEKSKLSALVKAANQSRIKIVQPES